MTKLLLTLVGAAVLATGAYAATTLVDDSDPARTVSLPGATTDDTRTDASEDISGPCDEAEHRNEPRCAGASPSAPRPAATTDDDEAEDISGPCDEAEHRNDPHCTGEADADDEDHSGPGRGDDDRGSDDDHEDRSGSNSGRD